MKKNTLVVLVSLFISVTSFAQHFYQSSCNAHDTIIKKYRKDAARLAVRYAHKNQLPYKDSLNVDKTLQKRYLNALMAVYNATIFSSRDTIFNLYNIHTNNTPGLNALDVNASDTVYWMKEIFNNQLPTTNTTIAYYFTKYNMQAVYYQSQPLDKVVFSTDSNLNMVIMQKSFLTIPEADTVAVIQPFNDSRNVIDTLDPNFIQLTFDYGWLTCLDTCDHHKYWTYKVYNDCKVEYKGHSGEDLNTAITNQSRNSRHIKLFPNPTTGIITLDGLHSPVTLELINGLGERLMRIHISDKEVPFDLTSLAPGLYFVRLSGEDHHQTIKFIKQ